MDLILKEQIETLTRQLDDLKQKVYSNQSNHLPNSTWSASEINDTIIQSRMSLDELIPPTGDYFLYTPSAKASQVTNDTEEDSIKDIESLIDRVNSICNEEEQDNYDDFLRKINYAIQDKTIIESTLSDNKEYDHFRYKTSNDRQQLNSNQFSISSSNQIDTPISNSKLKSAETRYKLPKLEYQTLIFEPDTIINATKNDYRLDSTMKSMYNEGLSLSSLEYLKRHHLDDQNDSSTFLDVDKIHLLPKLQ